MEIKFNYKDESRILNKAFWENNANLRDIDDETLENMKSAIEEAYKNCTHVQAEYFIDQLRFEEYIVQKKDPKKQATTQVKNYFGVEDSDSKFSELLKKQIEFSRMIKENAAEKSKEWFKDLCNNCFYSEENKDNEIEKTYVIASLTDQHSHFFPYLWYQHKDCYKENPVALSVFLFPEQKYRVCISLHHSVSSKTYINDLFLNKLINIFEIVQNPNKYNLNASAYNGLKFLITPTAGNPQGVGKQLYSVKKSNFKELEFQVADKGKLDESALEADKKEMKTGKYGLIFLFDDISVENEESDEDLKKKIQAEIGKLSDLYKVAAKTTVYEQEIYKAVTVRNMKQIIFTGAPGTGKTYGVKEYVQEVTEVKDGDKNNHRWEIIQFHPSYDYTDFVEGIRPISIDEDGKKEMEFVKIDGQFKKFCRNVVMDRMSKCKEYIEKNVNAEPSWKELYEKIEKAAVENTENLGNIKNKKVLEYIYAIAKKASLPKTASQLTENEKKLLSIFNAISDADSHLCYFVIDEINRADISKVFGELMYALEYRGIQNRMASQYSQISVTYHKDDKTKDFTPMDFDCFENGFFIPENVIVIGTMNDIDKSVEAFDFAMRRRFLWIQVKANDDKVLRGVLEGVFKNAGKKTTVDANLKKLLAKIKAMNEAIVKNGVKYGLTEDYQIGPSYFKNFNITSSKFEDCFRKEYDMLVAPTLKEYIRGRAEASKIEEFIKACYPVETTKKTESKNQTQSEEDTKTEE